MTIISSGAAEISGTKSHHRPIPFTTSRRSGVACIEVRVGRTVGALRVYFLTLQEVGGLPAGRNSDTSQEEKEAYAQYGDPYQLHNVGIPFEPR